MAYQPLYYGDGSLLDQWRGHRNFSKIPGQTLVCYNKGGWYN